jgi:hypothetical protein
MAIRGRAEQQNTEKCCLEHESRETLVAQQLTLDRAGLYRHHTPVGAELESHYDAGDHAHADEGNREDRPPEVEHPAVQPVAGHEARSRDRRQPSCQPDGEGREDDVKTDDEPELHASEDDRVKFHAHFHSDGFVVRRPATLISANGDEQVAGFAGSHREHERANLVNSHIT